MLTPSPRRERQDHGLILISRPIPGDEIDDVAGEYAARTQNFLNMFLLLIGTLATAYRLKDSWLFHICKPCIPQEMKNSPRAGLKVLALLYLLKRRWGLLFEKLDCGYTPRLELSVCGDGRGGRATAYNQSLGVIQSPDFSCGISALPLKPLIINTTRKKQGNYDIISFCFSYSPAGTEMIRKVAKKKKKIPCRGKTCKEPREPHTGRF